MEEMFSGRWVTDTTSWGSSLPSFRERISPQLAFISRVNLFSQGQAAGFWLAVVRDTHVDQIRGDPKRVVTPLLILVLASPATKPPTGQV